jgi:hypothetical protein
MDTSKEGTHFSPHFKSIGFQIGGKLVSQSEWRNDRYVDILGDDSTTIVTRTEINGKVVSEYLYKDGKCVDMLADSSFQLFPSDLNNIS